MSEKWSIDLADQQEAERIACSQRDAAHAIATAIETARPLERWQQRFAAAILRHKADHRSRSAGRPKQSTDDASYRSACLRAADALEGRSTILQDDTGYATEALRGFARGAKAARPRGRPRAVPGDAAILVEVIAPLSGRSKRAVKAEIAELYDTDISSVTRAVVAGRDDAKGFAEWIKASGARVHPKRGK